MIGKDLLVSSSEAYSRAYLKKAGYDFMIEFTVKPRAIEYFESVGVVHRTAAASKGWAARGIYFGKPSRALEIWASNRTCRCSTHGYRDF